MQVSRYLFQSPSTSQIQIGKPDPSAVKEDTNGTTNAQSQMITATESKTLDIKQAQDTLVANKQYKLDLLV